MSVDEITTKGHEKHYPKSRAYEIANTFSWLILAFILAFIFRAFIMEPFRIPTGSMADTLMGAHFRLRCSQCGYVYNFDFEPKSYGFDKETLPQNVHLPESASRCPVCGFYHKGGNTQVSNGDRILVLKNIYQFAEPKQWDVIVFKNPLNPYENYIKRLIGRPGQKVEIIDGDIYIDEKISRKPPKVQQELWMPVYNNNHQPVNPQENSFNGHIWQQPFRMSNSNWKISKSNPTEFILDSPIEQINWLSYDSSTGNDFKATYAYNHTRYYTSRPYCSDLMVCFYIQSTKPGSNIGISLSKYETKYKAKFTFNGEMIISKNGEEPLVQKQVDLSKIKQPVMVKFAIVDHQLIFEFGNEKLPYDLGAKPEDAGPIKTNIEPQIKILGSGKLRLSHITISRDIYYTSANGSSRASEGNPFKLGDNEYFVLGDNSPRSEDSRWWNYRGIGNNGITYNKGIVPRDYLVGKALVVYWPSGFKPFVKFPFAIIPNIGKMRLIHGGSHKKL